MSDEINEKTSWWKKQSTGAKAGIGIAGICCLGLLLILGMSAMASPDETTSSSSNDSSQNTDSAPAPVAAESESQYKASCKTIGFKELEKNPDKYVGQRVKYSGTVLQAMESYGTTDIRMDVNDNYGDTIYVLYDGTTSAVEDSFITVYGEVDGSYSYTSQAGWEITLPKITAKYVVTK